MHCSTSDQETDWSFEVHNISSRGNLLADRLPIIHPPLYNPGDSPNTARFRRVRPLLPKGAFRYPRMSRGGDFVRTYEVMTIYRPELAETEVRTAVAEMEELLRSRGAEITESEFWGKRRFAYEIDHLTEGFYSVVEFQSDGSMIGELDRVLSLADGVLRHKVIRSDG